MEQGRRSRSQVNQRAREERQKEEGRVGSEEGRGRPGQGRSGGGKRAEQRQPALPIADLACNIAREE